MVRVMGGLILTLHHIRRASVFGDASGLGHYPSTFLPETRMTRVRTRSHSFYLYGRHYYHDDSPYGEVAGGDLVRRSVSVRVIRLGVHTYPALVPHGGSLCSDDSTGMLRLLTSATERDMCEPYDGWVW